MNSQAISQAHQTPKQDDDALSLHVSLRQPAGSQHSPAGVLFPEDPVVRFERLTRETMEVKISSYKRLLQETREREICARERAGALEKALADMHKRQQFQHSIASMLAVALVLAIFALLA